jgi:hypothetical protein
MFQHCDSQDCIISTASIEREIPWPDLAILIRLTLSKGIFERNTPEALSGPGSLFVLRRRLGKQGSSFEFRDAWTRPLARNSKPKRARGTGEPRTTKKLRIA